MENNVCSICGAHLSENNTEGIGFECKAALRQAKIHKLFQDKDFSLYYNWIIEASAWRDIFIKTFAETKFRSDFKKSFYKSILECDRISRKQLDIIRRELSYRGINIKVDVTEIKKSILNDKISKITVSIDEINAARKFIKSK